MLFCAVSTLPKKENLCHYFNGTKFSEGIPMAPRGRPPTGRNSDRPVTVYLSPEDRAALDRLADLRTIRTGKNTSRSDLVREAVKMLLQADLHMGVAETPLCNAGIVHTVSQLSLEFTQLDIC